MRSDRERVNSALGPVALGTGGGSGIMAMSSFWQNALLAGPFLGFVSAVEQHRLEMISPDRKNEATHQVIRQSRIWHGHFLGDYYITPGQFFIQECLAIPVACWMILAVLGLVGIGIRTEADRRRSRRR